MRHPPHSFGRRGVWGEQAGDRAAGVVVAEEAEPCSERRPVGVPGGERVRVVLGPPHQPDQTEPSGAQGERVGEREHGGQVRAVRPLLSIFCAHPNGREVTP